jgi:hypothetical protein
VTDPCDNKGFRILDKVAAKALDNAKFRQELLADPGAVLSAEGLELPEGVEIVVMENTADRIYLVLPAELPGEAELAVDDVHLGKMIPFTKF